MTNVGVIGLGGMGQALALALISSGYSVTCFDRREDALREVRECGATAGSSARNVAEGSDLVFTSLPGPAQVLSVVLDAEDGVLAGLAPDTTLIEMSTCTPDVSAILVPKFVERGAYFVDCPVSGKAPAMTVLIGGENGALGENEQVLRDVSTELIYCGSAGSGYATKLLNQHVKYSWYLASAEALLVAETMGMDPTLVAEAIAHCSGGKTGLTDAAEFYLDADSITKVHAPSSTIDKDMALAQEMADQAGVECPSLDVVADFFHQVGATPYAGRQYIHSAELLRTLRTEGSKPL